MQRKKISTKEIKPIPIKEVKQEITQTKKSAKKYDFSMFRKLEKEYAPHKPRTRSEFKDNYSISLAMDEKIVSSLFAPQKNYSKQLELFERHIMEHAARRIDLFFYTLVAYYKRKLPVTLGWSKLQHGKGKFNFKSWEAVTNAAHSSIVTTILDEHILKKEAIESKIKDSNLHMKTSLLCGTHFMDSLNSTVELPPFINELDFLIEFKRNGRYTAGLILQKVSSGELNPVEGLHEFILNLKEILDSMLAFKEIYESENNISNEEKRLLVELVKKGTLINKLGKDGKSVNDEYIYMLLRLSKDEINDCNNANKREKILEMKMMEISKEILGTPSMHLT